MRILFVTGIFPPDIGGPATYTDRMGTELATRGHDVEVVTLSDSPTDATDADRPMTVHRIRRHQNTVVRAVRVLSAILRYGSQADVIFVQSLTAEAAVANYLLDAPMYARVVGDKAWEVSHRREWARVSFDEFQRERFGPRVESLRALRTWSVGRMDRIVAASEYFADQIRGWWIDTEITHVPNFIETPDSFAEATLPKKAETTIITVGRLVEYKRVGDLIEAVADLPTVELVVVGDGPERERWERQATEAGVGDRVTFLGKRPHDETLGLIHEADIFTLASTQESFGIVVLEAMAAGTPVVATAVGGPAEILTDGEDGLLVPAASPDELRDALSALAANPERAARLAERASETVARYELSAVADEVETLLESATAGADA